MVSKAGSAAQFPFVFPATFPRTHHARRSPPASGKKSQGMKEKGQPARGEEDVAPE
jgi:hypothetical protein